MYFVLHVRLLLQGVGDYLGSFSESVPQGHVQHGDMLLLSSGWNQNWPISCLIANNWRWFWFHHMVDTFVKSAQAHSRKIKSELSFIFFSLFSWFKSSAIAVLCQVVPKLPYSPYNTIPYHILSWEVCWSLKQTTTVKYAAKTKCYCFKLYSFEIINIHDNVK